MEREVFGAISGGGNMDIENNAIVVYDSYSGNTEKVGVEIAAGLGCKATHIKNIPQNEVKHDLVVVGTPVHMRYPTRRVRGFLEKAEIKNLALFCTYSFMGAKRTLDAMEKLGNSNVIGKLSVVGEHRIFRVKIGRPNTDDLAKARRFGEELKEKMQP